MNRTEPRIAFVVLLLILIAAPSWADRRDDDRRGDDDVAAEHVAAEHGAVRILLVGSCGPGDSGQRAVLQNGNVDSVRVRVETSRWIGGKMKARSTRLHRLDGDEEEDLGCTSIGKSAEQRYAIAEVDGGSGHRRRRRPLRDYVELTDGATCGRGGEGRQIVVANRHPRQQVKVSLVRSLLVQGKLRNRTVESRRLGPGEEKRLGCSRDGQLEVKISVREVE